MFLLYTWYSLDEKLGLGIQLGIDHIQNGLLCLKKNYISKSKIFVDVRALYREV
jgi:hypothetical protein